MPPTYTYSGDPSASDLDEVRFLLGDTDVSGGATTALFSDQEITWGINTWGPLFGSNLLTAAQLAENATAAYAQESSYSADGVSVSLGPIGDSLRALALTLKNQYAMSCQAGVLIEAGGMTEGEGMIPGTKPFAFGVGMDDAPDATRQDFGGDGPRDWPNTDVNYGAPGVSGP